MKKMEIAIALNNLKEEDPKAFDLICMLIETVVNNLEDNIKVSYKTDKPELTIVIGEYFYRNEFESFDKLYRIVDLVTLLKEVSKVA